MDFTRWRNGITW